jgi:transcriptional regulator
MYVPQPFTVPEPDDWAAGFIARHGFASLTAVADGALHAVPLPCVLEKDASGARLLAHVARANPIWQSFTGSEVLVQFHGANAYVSPDWYAAEHMVPTWNYEAVHIYGTPRLLEAEEDALRVLTALSAHYEADLLPKKPWTLDKMPPDLLRKLLRGIVAFEIPVARLAVKRKLSQNRSAADRAGVIAALRQRSDEDSRAIATKMAELESFGG